MHLNRIIRSDLRKKGFARSRNELNKSGNSKNLVQLSPQFKPILTMSIQHNKSIIFENGVIKCSFCHIRMKMTWKFEWKFLAEPKKLIHIVLYTKLKYLLWLTFIYVKTIQFIDFQYFQERKFSISYFNDENQSRNNWLEMMTTRVYMCVLCVIKIVFKVIWRTIDLTNYSLSFVLLWF